MVIKNLHPYTRQLPYRGTPDTIRYYGTGFWAEFNGFVDCSDPDCPRSYDPLKVWAETLCCSDQVYLMVTVAQGGYLKPKIKSAPHLISVVETATGTELRSTVLCDDFVISATYLVTELQQALLAAPRKESLEGFSLDQTTFWDFDKALVCPCPPGKIRLPDGTCGCPNNLIYNEETQQCECPPNTVYDAATQTCIPEPPPEIIQPRQVVPQVLLDPPADFSNVTGPARHFTKYPLYDVFVTNIEGYNCGPPEGQKACRVLGQLSIEAVTAISNMRRWYLQRCGDVLSNYCGRVPSNYCVDVFVWDTYATDPTARFWVEYFNTNVGSFYYGRREPVELWWQPASEPGFTGIQSCSAYPGEEWETYEITIALVPRRLPLQQIARTFIMRLPSPVVSVNEDGLYLELSNGDVVGPLGYTLSERIFYSYELLLVVPL